MVFWLVFPLEIAFLYLLSRRVTSKIYRFIKSNYFFALFFLPGTIIHELSHILMATLLFVPSGKLELIPKQIESGMKLGSVTIAKTDPIRRTLIGLAPIITGLIIIFTTVIYIKNPFLISFIVFEVANSMFSSKKDLEGTLPVFIIIFITFLILYMLGLRIDLKISQELIKQADIYLLLPIIIDALIVKFE